MTDFRPMQDLPKDAEFIGPDRRTRYRVMKPACEYAEGFVDVWNLSMTREEEQCLVASGDWEPRAGFFADSHPVDVEVIS